MYILCSLGCSFIFFLITLYFYLEFFLKSTTLNTLDVIYIYPSLSFLWTTLGLELSLDFFGFILLLLAYLAGIFSLIALDSRFLYRNINHVIYINIFTTIVFMYVLTNNLLYLFLFYEFLLLPSVIIVYFMSPSRRAVQVCLYFIIWTQIGSFLVLCVISYVLSICGSSNFVFIQNYTFTNNEVYFLFLFLFIGFGFKVPIWPLHYWLTKTHVEAPAGFSMYLSGFLVKTALYGFYKISNLLGGSLDTTFFLVICIIGVTDSSIKMWGQTDIKKLVAYATVQEMNLIYLAFCWGSSLSLYGGFLFCITHTALSTLMFFIVDCVQKRFNSRNVSEISGILQITPNLGVSILLMNILYSGLPGTLKFSSEIFIFLGIIESSFLFAFFLIFIANVVGLIGFSKCWFNILFGMNFKLKNLPVYDLTLRESITIICIFIFLIITTITETYTI